MAGRGAGSGANPPAQPDTPPTDPVGQAHRRDTLSSPIGATSKTRFRSAPVTQDRHRLANVSCYATTPEEWIAAKLVFAVIRYLPIIGRPVRTLAARSLEIMLDVFN
jgi:hypothetical protein